MKDIDEAIKDWEESADQLEKTISYYTIQGDTEWLEECEEECIEHAANFRQLAEWLKELKKWRVLRDSINMLCDVDCEYPQYRESGTMCNACPIGTVKEYFEQIFEKE